jgi:hypothetical protein
MSDALGLPVWWVRTRCVLRTRNSSLSVAKSGAFASRIDLSPGRTREFMKPLAFCACRWCDSMLVHCVRGCVAEEVLLAMLVHVIGSTMDRNVAVKRKNVAVRFRL